MSTIASALSDSRVMIGREVRHDLRSIDALVTGTAMPVLILTMFVFVFGGAITTGTGHYVDYVVPGVILLCAGFGSASTAVGVATDMKTGTIDRLRTLPIFAPAVLVGHVVASVIRNLGATTIVIAFALLYGFRSPASIPGWLLAVGMIVLCVPAFTWISCSVGLVVGPEAASGLTFVLLFLPYVSSGFVPTASMPAGLRWFANHQPLAPVTETVRSLLLGTPVHHGTAAVIWLVGVMAAGQTAAISLHRRRPAR